MYEEWSSWGLYWCHRTGSPPFTGLTEVGVNVLHDPRTLQSTYGVHHEMIFCLSNVEELMKKLSAQTQKFLSCSLVSAGLRWHHSRHLHLCFESQRWDSYQEMASDVTCTGLSVRRHLHSLVDIYTAFVGKQHIYLLVWENSSLPGVSRSGGSKNQNRDW